jgi:predicted nucleic acid-binding protein
VLTAVRDWASSGAIRWMTRDTELLWADALEVIERSQGRLNFNDALLAVLQQRELIGDVASFDAGFDVIPEFRRTA